MTKILDQISKEQTAVHEAKAKAADKAHVAERQANARYLLRNELGQLQRDLEALEPALAKAKQVKRQIADVEQRLEALG